MYSFRNNIKLIKFLCVSQNIADPHRFSLHDFSFHSNCFKYNCLLHCTQQSADANSHQLLHSKPSRWRHPYGGPLYSIYISSKSHISVLAFRLIAMCDCIVLAGELSFHKVRYCKCIYNQRNNFEPINKLQYH